MSRRVRYSELETPTARERLKAGKKVHWRNLVPGKLALGYRRRRKAVAGEWLKRTYVGRNEQGIGHYTQEVIGRADDFAAADGVHIFDFAGAQMRARDEDRPANPLTVREAITGYIEFLKANGKPTNDTERRANVHVIPVLGDTEVVKLTPEKIRSWLSDLATSPALVRSKKNGGRKTKAPPGDDPEAVRRRRSSANRVLTVLKAALNYVYDEGKVPDNSAWGRRVKPFKSVDVARVRYLTIAEARRLINASDPEFRPLVRAALETGARFGELTRLEVSDFNPDAGTLLIRQSKSGHSRHVILTDDGSAFFKTMSTGRAGSETMLLRNSGGPWKPSEQGRPIADANTHAKIDPPITFHGLRHTYASHAVMNGVPLMVVAKNLGHADTGMVEKHYGHLAPSYVADAIRAGAPRYGVATKGEARVASLDSARASPRRKR